MSVRILVAVRQVALLDDDFELADDGLGVDPDFVDREMNEWDTFSLEAALTLKDADEGGVEVVTVTIGDDEADEMLLGCLAKGADRAIRIPDDGPAADALANATVLAAIVERETPDLVLCGVQAADTVNGATGAALAGLRGLPCVAVVRSIELGDGEAVVERELEGGTIERLSVPVPAVLTVQTGINKPRYATLRAIKQARDKPLEVVPAADLGLGEAAMSAASGGRLRSLHVPEEENHAEMLEGDAGSLAVRIAELVKERVA